MLRGSGRWLAGALVILLVVLGWRRSRRERPELPVPEPVPVRPRPRLLPVAAALLLGVAVVVGLTAVRPASPANRRPATAVARLPTALSATRVPPRARPTPFRPPATKPAGAPLPTTTATHPAELPIGGTAVAAVRARGPLRGMGYNPTYATADVDTPLRADRIGRDMGLMAQVGVDMVLGWEPGVFDRTLLDAARANGIAVILPFDLKPDWDYADPALRQRLLPEVEDWVVRYRDDPAVLMWGLGNEVTIEMDEPERHAFAEFFVQAFELVRALDPTRPVILREAEDVFAPYLAEAFARRQGIWLDPATPTPTPADAVDLTEGAPAAAEIPAPTETPRPAIKAPEGFVYGVNFYTERVGPALADWLPNTGLDVPVLVSEYAPAGVGRAVRGDGFLRLHQLIADGGGPRVLGEAPYTWTTAGPEAVDDYFGLVDADGHPVDNALAAVALMYGVSPPAWTNVAEPRQQLANVADLPRLLRSAAAANAALSGRDEGDVHATARGETETAELELGIGPDGADEATARARRVAELIGWARELSSLRDAEGRRFFPGMHEALPLLNGMARWSFGEPSAVETAQGFMAAVLRRDLAALGG